MEFDFEKHKVIGIVQKKHFSNENAKIKAFGFIDEDNNVFKINENKAIEVFKPYGSIFSFDFFKYYPFKTDEIIKISVKPNIQSKEGHDEFILHRIYEKYGIPAYPLKGFSVSNQSIDLTSLQIDGNYGDGEFFGITKKYIIGKLKVRSGVLSPVAANKIYRWDIDANEDNLIRNQTYTRLIDEPISEYSIVDCLTPDELFDWFRKKLNQIDYESIKKINSIGKWQKEIPKLFEALSKTDAEIENLRLKRIEGYFAQIELDRHDIYDFMSKSSNLKVAFDKAIEKHIDDFQSQYSKKLKEIEDEVLRKEKELNENLNRSEHEAKTKIAALNTEIKKKQIETQKAIDEFEQSKQRLIEIEKEKSRIISDFGIVKEVLSLSSGTTSTSTEKNYILEEVTTEHIGILNIKDFINNVQYYLSDLKRNPDFAKRIIETMLVYKALFIKDIRIALSVIKASGNAKYIIQHTEPDWLHFKDFWNNGLSTIWNSAHESPEIPHFFVLEDVNLSSPECYARPLLDVIANIRSKIPFAETSYPNNLIIFATKASSQNPTIGLNLYKETFPDWGSIAYKNDINRISGKEFSLINGKIDSTIFSFDNLESDIEDIKNSVSSESEKLFDEE
ncbi:MAG: hypothetical protein H6Q14_394 [Bacteroidetes bacterium]|nr:hypothetical protein [Bacteroidota bacterium]